MNIKLAIAAASMVALGACMTAEEPSSAPSSAVSSLVGKPLVNAQGTTFLFNADGTVGGTFRGEEIVGTYTADATEVCSTYTAPSQLTGREFCSTPEFNGNQVTFNRRDGSNSGAYTIGG